jgi:uncharacterized membrane protein (UPF0127 family)
MRSIAKVAAALLLGTAGAACAAAAQGGPTPTATLRGHTFTLEVASTPAAQEHGLMDRTSMAANHGMLFVFADSEPRTFWMKNTRIPLDMLFFDGQRRLVAIQLDAAPCKADPCALYPSGVPARYVLELNAGTAHRLGLRKGDVVTLSGVAALTQ